MKKMGSNYLFVKPHIDAIFLLTAFELLNVVSIWLILSLKSITGNSDLDVTIGAICIFTINAFLKLYKKRYIELFQKFEKNTKLKKASNIVIVLYVLLSIFIFYFVHYRTI